MQTENHERDCGAGEGPEQRFDIHAIGLDTQKCHGDVAEARFLAKAASMGFGVAKPWSDERYDFILDSGYCLWRVQVKSTRRHASRGYSVTIASSSLARYEETEIDFLVAYISPEEVCYVIPVRMIKGQNFLHFYPSGRGKSKWEKFREGWCQMACPYDEFGPSKIVTPRCRDNGPVQMAICPLKVLR
jgi:PD-(D/E)XK endonuclease